MTNTQGMGESGEDASASETPTSSFGRYLGELILKPDDDGRRMHLVEPYGFEDPAQKKWAVPARAVVDGASIPRPLWSIIGGPFTGKYRNASVIHDYYCDVRTEPWREVHRVFYNAMRASGVSEKRAKLMYGGVYFAGPRWGGSTVNNTQLLKTRDLSEAFSVRHSPLQVGMLEATSVDGESARAFLQSGEVLPRTGRETSLDLKQLESLIGEHNPDLPELEAAIDGAARVLEFSITNQDNARSLLP